MIKENLKKIFVFLFLSILSVFLFCQENENPFISIMGMKWRTTASNLKKKFKFQDGFYFEENPEQFELILSESNFPLITEPNEPLCFFVFKSKEKGLEFKEENYSLFLLDSAYEYINSDQFDSELHYLTKRFGKPAVEKKYKIQKKWGRKIFHNEVMWINGDRKITLYRGMDIIRVC